MTTPEIKPVATIVGPTASGKTALALALAEHYSLEVISADSMQVYRRLDVGTAKPTTRERAIVPHHLIDVADPHEKYDLARFLHDALHAIEDIRSRGKIPLIVGGTGLYLKSLMSGIFAVPSRDPLIRSTLMQRAEAEGLGSLHVELNKVDPKSAARISVNDSIRIVRALEVFLSTGRSMTEWHEDPNAPQTPAVPLSLVALNLPRELLNERIEARVGVMLQQGWVEEVRALLDSGLSPQLHCFKALGYGEIARRLIANETMDGVKEAINQETRQFAKRQMTWFRAMKTARWLDVASTPVQAAVDQAAGMLGLH